MQVSIREKVILIILATIAGITAISVIAGVTLSSRDLKTTIINDMTVSGAIAEQLVSEKIGGVKTSLRVISEICRTLEEDRIAEFLRNELSAQAYLSLGLMYQDGRIIFHGAGTGDGEFFKAGSARQVPGDEVTGTTEYDGSGALILRFRMALEDGSVLAAALPGTLISDILSRFRIRQTGSIFVLDREGTFIAGMRPALVQNRINYLKLAETDREYLGAADLYSRMIRGASGAGEYSYRGAPMICVYRPVRGSDGWSLGLVCPLAEDPLSLVQRSFLITGALFLGLGSAAAFAAAVFIVRPFKRAEELALAAELEAETKSRFLAGMSQEMRGPLKAITGLAEWELGKTEDDSGDSQANLEHIHRSGLGLLELIDDLQDIARIESGTFELVPVRYDLPGLINDTVARGIVRMGDKPVAFTLDIDENLPLRLFGDERRVRQILNGLLSRAFENTEEGEVRLKIRCDREDGGVRMSCSVSDTGLGICEEDLDQFFGGEGQAKGGEDPAGEPGLGLELTRRLVEAMGGKLYVKSEYDRGSTFMARFFQAFAGEELIGKETAVRLGEFSSGLARRNRNRRMPRGQMPGLKAPEGNPGLGNAGGNCIRIVESGGGTAELTLKKDEWEALREVESSLKIADMIRAAALEELDWERGLERFGGDGRSYMDSLRSYVVRAQALVLRIRTVGALDEYAVVLHSLKVSSYGIAADSVGLKAERLEQAAKNSNWAFVEAEHDRFIEALEKFILRLTDLLDTLDLMGSGPDNNASDRILLNRVLRAVENFDLAELDRAMEDLEHCEYDVGPELVAWLRDRIGKSEYDAVKLRLRSQVYASRSPWFDWPVVA
jgi:signal transduction histidine kinase